MRILIAGAVAPWRSSAEPSELCGQPERGPTRSKEVELP